MKNYLAIMVVIFFSQIAFAQTKSEEGNPSPSLAPGAPARPQKADSVDQKEDRVEISREKLPSSMLKELENNPRYEGWEEGNVFYEQNTDQFIVHVIRDNSTQTFRFDKEGHPLQNNENLDVPDKKN
jgi:hypothetical protein